MNGKQFTVSILCALVLLTLVFIPLASQQGGGTYDPWLDYNEDGKIDVTDLQPLGQAYGASGDATKNVTIAKHTSKVIKVAEWVSVPGYTYWFSGHMVIDGYSTVTVRIRFDAVANVYALICSDTVGVDWWEVDYVANFEGFVMKTYDVMNQKIEIQVWNGDSDAKILYVEVYLVA